jgi:uncharacterized protein (TIGR00266 family)
MKYQISSDSISAVVNIKLDQNEQVRIQRGAMVSQTSGITLEGKTNGGIFSALGKSLTSGESIFKTIASSNKANQTIVIAPPSLGAIKVLPVNSSNQWRLNDQAYLACDITVDYNMKRQSLGRALVGGTGGLYVMETVGQGELLINGFGEIMEVNLDGSEEYIVDNDHVLAWSSSLNYDIAIASGTFGFKSGEGVVNRFNGVGTVYIQTRSLTPLAQMVARAMPNR